MFLKLFKYDFLAVIKKLVFYFIVVVGLAVFSKIINLIFYNSEFALIAVFPSFSYLISVYLGMLVPIILCMVRYYKNMLSDEGYLTHTLPVKKSTLLLSKLAVTLVMEFLTLATIILSLLIYSFESIPDMAQFILKCIQEFDPSYIGSVYGLIALGLFELLCCAVFQVTEVAMCLTLGATHNKSKLVFAFLYYVIINFVLQIIIGIISAVLVIVFSSIENYQVGHIYLILSFIILLTIVAIVIAYIINLFCLKRKLNLE